MKLLLFVSVCAWAQIEPPRIGMMLDSNGTARPVYGLTASVTLGDPVAGNVESLACSASGCAIKLAERVVFGASSYRTPRGPALFAFANDGLYVYCAGRLSKDGEPVDVQVTGEVLAMRMRDRLEFAVRRDGNTWIVTDGDIVVDALSGATGPVMLLGDAVIYAAGGETILRRDDGSETHLPVHADAFLAMSEDFIEIRSARVSYAFRLSSQKLFQLPEAQ